MSVLRQDQDDPQGRQILLLPLVSSSDTCFRMGEVSEMKIMNMAFVYRSSQWGAKVVLYVGARERFLEYLKRRHHCNYRERWSEDFCALSFRMLSQTDGHVTGYCIWLPEMNFHTDQYVSLAHECLHAAVHILDDRGVVYDDDAKESLTYTFDDIYGNFLKMLHRFYKKTDEGNTDGKN